jgi:hypothetical protein
MRYGWHLTDTPRGEDRKRLAEDIAREANSNRHDLLLIFCQGSCPSTPKGTPVSVASCTAWHRGLETSHSTKAIGQGADTTDAAVEAITLATTLAAAAMTQQPQIKVIKIFTTDAHLPKKCANRNHRDLSSRSSNLFQSLANPQGPARLSHPFFCSSLARNASGRVRSLPPTPFLASNAPSVPHRDSLCLSQHHRRGCYCASPLSARHRDRRRARLSAVTTVAATPAPCHCHRRRANAVTVTTAVPTPSRGTPSRLQARAGAFFFWSYPS